MLERAHKTRGLVLEVCVYTIFVILFMVFLYPVLLRPIVKY